MRTRIATILLALASAAAARADNLERSFPAGAGSRFAFSSAMAKGEVVIAIAASAPGRVAVECYFSAGGKEMWEQFTVDVSSGAPVVADGYLLTADGQAPERIPPDLLKGLDDVALTDFLITDRAQLERYKKGVERITIPASHANVSATRYEQPLGGGGQTITFWISDEAKPIGLVKLESRGPKPSQTYALELLALVHHVGRKIDPAKAVPLSREGRALLGTMLR
jgi:hypothetical protein